MAATHALALCERQTEPMDVTAPPLPQHSKARDIALLLLLCPGPWGGKPGALGLIDPGEPFYAQTAREMLARHEWVVPHIFGAQMSSLALSLKISAPPPGTPPRPAVIKRSITS